MGIKLHTAEQFIADLKVLGIKSGDTVFMHSSYKALGGIEGGAKTVFSSIFELLGEKGTLILPAFSYDTVGYENPHFYLQDTPSCIGYLPEYFRTQVDGVIRSMHATHSCCLKGFKASKMALNHELDLTPVGENSPISKLPLMDGKILMLGCNPNHNTALHGVEEIVNAPYIFDGDKKIDYFLHNGDKTINMKAFRHSFLKNGIFYDQKYSRVIDLLSKDEYSFSKVLDADCYLMSAQAVWQKAKEKLLNDPYYFVDAVNQE